MVRRLKWAFVLLLSCVASAQSGPSGEVGDDRIDDILRRVEQVGADVSDLACRIEYEIHDRLSDDRIAKSGSIYYKRSQPNPKFAIVFDKLVQEDVVREKKEWFLFDGTWLWEAKQASTTVIKREVVRPGERIDLFDIENAPFPVPFGQKKDDIRRNFVVTLVEPQPGDPADTDHLLCSPKPDSKLSRQYQKLEFFVRQGLDLSVKIVLTERGGHKVVTAYFPDLSVGSLNTGLPERSFLPRNEWSSYTLIEEPFAEPHSNTGTPG